MKRQDFSQNITGMQRERLEIDKNLLKKSQEQLANVRASKEISNENLKTKLIEKIKDKSEGNLNLQYKGK